MTSHFLSPLSRISLFLLLISLVLLFFFFFHDTATPEIYTFPYTTLFRSGRVVLPADVVDRHREHGRAHEGVPTPVHRCRAGVRRLTVDVDVHATHRIAADDDADGHGLTVEDRPLLDVQLEVRIDRPAADVLLAGVADALELATETLAVVVAQPGHHA